MVRRGDVDFSESRRRQISSQKGIFIPGESRQCDRRIGTSRNIQERSYQKRIRYCLCPSFFICSIDENLPNICFLPDEPSAPGKPLVMDWDQNHVELEWTPPKSDGGRPLTGYIVQKKEKGSPYWVNAVHVPAKQTNVSS